MVTRINEKVWLSSLVLLCMTLYVATQLTASIRLASVAEGPLSADPGKRNYVTQLHFGKMVDRVRRRCKTRYCVRGLAISPQHRLGHSNPYQVFSLRSSLALSGFRSGNIFPKLHGRKQILRTLHPQAYTAGEHEVKFCKRGFT